LIGAATAFGQSSLAGEPIRVSRTTARITIDGDLSDEGWQHATRIEKWYEVNPGDNVEPKVRNVGYLAYDDRFFYAGFEFEDKNPKSIRAPFGDRDDIGNGFDDYGGVLLDPRNTGHTGTFFVVTPHNIQYDSITDDSSGEDSSPDFFWESATRITATGWTLEIKIPFSSLRYRNADPQTWSILLYRNFPREFHYQFFSAQLPRGGNCLVCRANPLVGLEGLPSGGHLVAAPYASVSQAAFPRDGLGSPLVNDSAEPHVGLDVKFTPNADNAVDFTVKPDFSQVESDTAQISANERFALSYPEKRPFFLEGVDLFRTPIQAVYTRTITSPRWGARATGKEHGVRYTVLVADDAGGGSAILPGPNGSSFAAQNFGSNVFIGRAKHDMGLSYVGVFVTDREAHDLSAHNRVVGPDFQWRPSSSNAVRGQWLFSESLTPNLPDLASEWTGRSLTGTASSIEWDHNTRHVDWNAVYRDLSSGFRADDGFVPQVGYREGAGGGGLTFWPKGGGFIFKVRTSVDLDRQVDRSGALIYRDVTPGLGIDTKFNGFFRLRYNDDVVRSGNLLFNRKQVGYTIQFSPSRTFSQLTVSGNTGRDVDFQNSRPAHGTTINLSGLLNPTNHLAVSLIQNTRRLEVDTVGSGRQRLLTARVSRVKGTYTFTPRLFVRGIVQYVSTDAEPSLYFKPVPAQSGTVSGSALFAYKLNWQSVMFFGYGDDRELLVGTNPDANRYAKVDRQLFVKISYALQR
jgi:hypothetical protein